MKRKSFIKTSGLIAGGIMISQNRLLADLFKSETGLKTIRGNIGIYSEQGGTIGWLINDDAFVVIDAQNPKSAKNMYSLLKEKTNRQIDILFNTHHHGDHTSGNYYLKDYAKKIVANKHCVELQKKFYGNGDKASQQVYAGTVFEEEMTFDIGNDKIVAKHFFPAHTGGDAIYHFVNNNVVHVGDLVFNNIFPWIDVKAGNSFKGWIKYLNKIIELFDDDTLFVFGHGLKVTGKKEDLIKKRDYFKALIDFVEHEIKMGKTKENIINRNSFKGDQSRKEAWKNAAKMSLEAAYNEIQQLN